MEMAAFAQQSALFTGIEKADLERMLGCAHAAITTCRKGEIVLQGRQAVSKVGLLLSGKLLVARDDIYGNHYLLSHISDSGLFGLSIALAKQQSAGIYIYAEIDSRVMLLDAKKLFDGCEQRCECHGLLLKNALTASAIKNLSLIRKQCHMSQHSLRGKLSSYLLDVCTQENAHRFTIGLKRQELADYLGVDRSALCAELSRMRRDGLIDYRLNSFTLYDKIFE